MKFLLASSSLLAIGGGGIGIVDAFVVPPPSSSHRASSTTSLRMASGGRMNVRPIGIGSASPVTLITNQDLESVHDTSDEWIRTRTGITQRRVLVHDGNREGVIAMKEKTKVAIDAAEGEKEGEDGRRMVPENLRSLGIEASMNALAMSGISPSDIDVVICATSSPDDLFGDAPSIAHAIGCDSRRVVAFDLTAACSGFLFGIVTAGQYLNNNGGSSSKNALVIGQDALTRWVDWDDRNSCILFGDGAGAMVLTSSSASSSSGGDDDEGKGDDEGFGILGYAMHSNGGGYDDLKCK
jgi:3-oxoacyl-[acyl-carrier-protein] synthase-3